MVIAILLMTIQSVDGTMTLSNSFLRLLIDLCKRISIETADAWWNTSDHIRRIGHVIEYTALGITAGIAVDRAWKGLLLCIAVSLLDQYTKIFVPVRHFDIKDFPFDLVGIALGLAVLMIVKGIIRTVSGQYSKKNLKSIRNVRAVPRR